MVRFDVPSRQFVMNSPLMPAILVTLMFSKAKALQTWKSSNDYDYWNEYSDFWEPEDRQILTIKKETGEKLLHSSNSTIFKRLIILVIKSIFACTIYHNIFQAE